MDKLSKESRSRLMSKIHGGLKNNKLERTVHNWLKGNRVKHRMYPKIIGNPDVMIKNNNNPIYVFIDGCFWHCCSTHYRRPKTHKRFWIAHIEKSNERREKLRKKLPYKYIRIWEHDVRNGEFKKMIRGSIGKNEQVR